MKLAIGGVAANFVVLCLLYAGNDPALGEFISVMFVIWGGSSLGLILCACGARKTGAILVILSSIAFVPLGMIAIIGAARMLRPAAEVEADLERRRLAAHS